MIKQKIAKFIKGLETSAKFLLGAFIISASSFLYTVIAAPPASPYNLGETLAPTCAPGDTNCTVDIPQEGNAYLDDISAITGTQGDLIYFNGTDWVDLAPGTDGQFLKTQGTGANPMWDSAGGASLWTANGSDIYFNTGSVGIGTANPSSILHVEQNNNAASDIILVNDNSGVSAMARLMFENDVSAGGIGIVSSNCSAPASFANRVLMVGEENTAGLLFVAMDAIGDIVFQTGGTGSAYERMRISSSGNVGIGDTTPLAALSVAGRIEQVDTGRSVFLGEYAGDSDDFSDNRNIFIGYNAGRFNTTGRQNIAIGYNSFRSNTIAGDNNTAIGYQSLFSNTTGDSNTASGHSSLALNSSGNDNTADGYQSLNSNAEGNANTAIGCQSLTSSTGYYNTAIGYRSLYSNTSGNWNTAIGYNTGLGITSGSYNTILGSQVTGLAANLTNNVIIADGQGNQRMRIDSTGNVGVGTVSPNMELAVNGYATSANFVSTIPLWQASSAYNMTNTSGSDLSNCESAIDPTIYEPNGNIEVKLVVRYISSAGTNNFQLRAHNGTAESWPIVNTDISWALTETGGVATSQWKVWNAGTNPQEIHLHGWTSSGGNINFTSAYLLVRPAQP